MRYRRIKISLLTSLAVALVVGLPSSAPASSLLSGYGGPGQGNQVILGATLLNGPSNRGGGGGGSGGGGSTGRLASTGTSALASPATSSSTAHLSEHPTGSATASGDRKGAAGQTVKRASRTAPAGARPAPAPPPASRLVRSTGDSRILGLSGTDLFYVILALVLLTLTGLITRALVRGAVPQERAAVKGMHSATRRFE